MEQEHRTNFNDIKKEDLKGGCCFKKRAADFFLIGATRAFFKNVLPKTLDKKEKYAAFNISPKDSDKKTTTLSDKENFWNLFRILAYAHEINNAGNNNESEEWKNSHKVIIDGRKCTKIAQKYFKGGWSSPSHDSFMKLVLSDLPDDKIVDELGIIDFKFEEENLEE